MGRRILPTLLTSPAFRQRSLPHSLWVSPSTQYQKADRVHLSSANRTTRSGLQQHTTPEYDPILLARTLSIT